MLDGKYGSWVQNVLVCKDGTLMTVLPRGVVEVRGDGWAPRRNSKRAKAYGQDHDCRVVKMKSVRRAREFCEEVARQLFACTDAPAPAAPAGVSDPYN